MRLRLAASLLIVVLLTIVPIFLEEALARTQCSSQVFIDGYPVRWALEYIPEITFRLDESIPQDWHLPISRAAAAWNVALREANIFLQFNTRSQPNSENLIKLGTGQNTMAWVDWNEAKGHEPTPPDNTWKITMAPMVFNAKLNWSTSNTSLANSYDVQGIATHEFGHWLGLDDLGFGLLNGCKGRSVMVGLGFNTAKDSKALRQIKAEDKEGLKIVYAAFTQAGNDQSRANPHIVIFPLSGLPGTNFDVEYSGLTANGNFLSILRYLDGVRGFDNRTATADSDGRFTHTIDSTGFQPGRYELTIRDTISGRSSPSGIFTILGDQDLGDRSSQSIEKALDANSNCVIDEQEFSTAVKYFVNGRPVPNTDGQTINDAKLKELQRMWILGTQIPECTRRPDDPVDKPQPKPSNPFITIEKRIRSASHSKCRNDPLPCDDVIDLTQGTNNGSRDVIFTIRITNNGDKAANVEVIDDLGKGAFQCWENCSSSAKRLVFTESLEANGGERYFEYRARYIGSNTTHGARVTNTLELVWIDNYYDKSRGIDNGGHGALTSRQTVTISNPQPIRQNKDPDADFSYRSTNPTVNEPITFRDQSVDPDGVIVERDWNFGDGTGSTKQNPTHTYTRSGSYSVCLTVVDNEGASDRICDTVVVKAQPTTTRSFEISDFTMTSGIGRDGRPVDRKFTFSLRDPAAILWVKIERAQGAIHYESHWYDPNGRLVNTLRKSGGNSGTWPSALFIWQGFKIGEFYPGTWTVEFYIEGKRRLQERFTIKGSGGSPGPPPPPPPPPKDSDGDGIPDDRDECPYVAGPPPTGCPRDGFIIGPALPPVADSLRVIAPQGGVVYFTVTGHDPDGDPIVYTAEGRRNLVRQGDPVSGVLTTPSEGVLDISSFPEIRYDAPFNFVGITKFTFQLSDGKSASAPATVSILVTPVAGMSSEINAKFLAGQQSVLFENQNKTAREIQVVIFSLAGEKVFASNWQPGNTLIWRAENNVGQRLPNGVYLYVVSIRNYAGEILKNPVRKIAVLN